MCVGGVGATPFPGWLHFTLDPYLIMLSVKHQVPFFKVFGMTQPEIEPRSPGPLANTLYSALKLIFYHILVEGLGKYVHSSRHKMKTILQFE